MQKEQILSLLKASVMTCAQTQGPMEDVMKEKLNSQTNKTKQGFEALSQNDKEWIEEEYSRWFEGELIPSLPPNKRRLLEFLRQAQQE